MYFGIYGSNAIDARLAFGNKNKLTHRLSRARRCFKCMSTTTTTPKRGRVSGSPVTRRLRAQVRKYLQLGGDYATIRADLNVSITTIKRIKQNKWADRLEEDERFFVKQEDGGGGGGDVARKARADEVITISSDSESESDEEAEGTARKLRSAMPKRKCPVAQDPQPVRSEDNVAAGAQWGPVGKANLHKTPGKRVRFDLGEDSDSGQAQKRQRRNWSPPHESQSNDKNGSTVSGSRPQRLSSELPRPSLRAGPANEASRSIDSIRLERLSLDPAPQSLLPEPLEHKEDSDEEPEPLQRLLNRLGLSHSAGILRNAGFDSLGDLSILKKGLANEKMREEIHSTLDARGMSLRDWLLLSESFVPAYGK
ncbi:hypothetical protein C8R46DRAFT_1091549 [Mycena filopes]|nr:hypothetical protein C8R46DRAFT_1091549 [Mycena filopes]